MKTIFYSWQSDINYARSKIGKALGIISERLNNKLELADRPEIDSDTKGTYGSEEITTTIFEKIDKCKVFVADVTPIATSGEKLIPNPNVMTELGYAMKAKPKFTRLYIFLTEGKIDKDKMPFDIRGKSLHGFKKSSTPTEIADKLSPILEEMLKGPDTEEAKLTFLRDAGGGWANWGGSGQGSGFRYKISIDNYLGPLDYIDDIYVRATDEWGDPWRTTHFKFDGLESKERMRIDASEMKDVWAFMTNVPGQTQAQFPAIDTSPVYIAVVLKSDGKERLLKLPAIYLRNK